MEMVRGFKQKMLKIWLSTQGSGLEWFDYLASTQMIADFMTLNAVERPSPMLGDGRNNGQLFGHFGYFRR